MPVTNLKSFNSQLRAWARHAIPENVRRVQKKLVIDLLVGIMEKSIVLTGLSRGNWFVSIGTIDVSSLPNAKASFSEVLAQAQAELASLGLNDIVWVNNNTEYIFYLEEGTPKMAAVHMVGDTLQDLDGGFL